MASIDAGQKFDEEDPLFGFPDGGVQHPSVELRQKDIFWSGMTTIAISIIEGIVVILILIEFDDNVGYDTESELTTFHNTIESLRGAIMIVAGLLYFLFPILVANVYFFKRLYELLFPLDPENANDVVFIFLKWSFVTLMIVDIVIASSILPTILLSLSYYDWEFDSTTGYYIQALGARFVLVLVDASTWVSGFMVLNLWVTITLGISNVERRIKFLPQIGWKDSTSGQINSIVIILFILIILIIFATFADSFSWAKSGIFAIDGKGRYISVITFVSYVFIGLWLLQLSRNFGNKTRR